MLRNIQQENDFFTLAKHDYTHYISRISSIKHSWARFFSSIPHLTRRFPSKASSPLSVTRYVIQFSLLRRVKIHKYQPTSAVPPPRRRFSLTPTNRQINNSKSYAQIFFSAWMARERTLININATVPHTISRFAFTKAFPKYLRGIKRLG